MNDLANTILLSTLYISYVTVALPIVFILVRFSAQPRLMLLLALYLGSSLFCDLLSWFLLFNGISPNYGGSLYAVLNLPLFYLWFREVDVVGQKWRAAWIPVAMTSLFAIINMLLIQKDSINSYSSTINCLLLLVFCIFFYFRLLSSLPATDVMHMPVFWIVSAVFFTNAGKIVIYTLSHYMINVLNDNLIVVWTVHNILTNISNLLIFYGAWLHHRQHRSILLSESHL